MFFCKFPEIFKSINFTENLRATDSGMIFEENCSRAI